MSKHVSGIAQNASLADVIGGDDMVITGNPNTERFKAIPSSKGFVSKQDLKKAILHYLGIVFPKYSQDEIDAMQGLSENYVIENIDTGELQRWNGTEWLPLGSGSGGSQDLQSVIDAGGVWQNSRARFTFQDDRLIIAALDRDTGEPNGQSVTLNSQSVTVDGIDENGIGFSMQVASTGFGGSKNDKTFGANDQGIYFPSYDTAGRDAIADPSLGQTINNTDTNTLQKFDGSNWVEVGSGGGTGGGDLQAAFDQSAGEGDDPTIAVPDEGFLRIIKNIVNKGDIAGLSEILLSGSDLLFQFTAPADPNNPGFNSVSNIGLSSGEGRIYSRTEFGDGGTSESVLSPSLFSTNIQNADGTYSTDQLNHSEDEGYRFTEARSYLLRSFRRNLSTSLWEKYIGLSDNQDEPNGLYRVDFFGGRWRFGNQRLSFCDITFDEQGNPVFGDDAAGIRYNNNAGKMEFADDDGGWHAFSSARPLGNIFPQVSYQIAQNDIEPYTELIVFARPTNGDITITLPPYSSLRQKKVTVILVLNNGHTVTVEPHPSDPVAMITGGTAPVVLKYLAQSASFTSNEMTVFAPDNPTAPVIRGEVVTGSGGTNKYLKFNQGGQNYWLGPLVTSEPE